MGADRQLSLAVGTSQNRNLFPVHFLERRLPEWPEYQAIDTASLFDELVTIWHRERDVLPSFTEEQTEDRWIRPVLTALGFVYTPRPKLSIDGRRREPDYALFLDVGARAESERGQGVARYAGAAALVEAKRFDRPLDRRRAAASLSEDPVAQIIYYVSTTRVPFGILTNGRFWRLYAQQGDLVEGAYYEVDLIALLESGDPNALRSFAAFFSAWAFAPDENGVSFLERALAESRANAIEIGDRLQVQVFAAVPRIAQGLLGEEDHTEENLADAFENALVFLYRTLFCLHAEARRLLPVDSPHYLEYSVRKQRQDLEAAIDRGRVFSATSDRLYNELEALFKLVSTGDDALGVNEYDGDLFAAGKHPWLRERIVPDSLLAPALDGLYRADGQSIDYRDLSVRQLGTIYERLLAYRLEPAEDGGLVLAEAPGRHDSGSYFTPEPIVDLIVERTLEPLLEQRSAEIAERGLRGKRALDRFLELKVVDPAMGSGHFLVSAASYISKFIATDPSYDGPLEWQQIEPGSAIRWSAPTLTTCSPPTSRCLRSGWPETRKVCWSKPPSWRRSRAPQAMRPREGAACLECGGAPAPPPRVRHGIDRQVLLDTDPDVPLGDRVSGGVPRERRQPEVGRRFRRCGRQPALYSDSKPRPRAGAVVP